MHDLNECRRNAHRATNGRLVSLELRRGSLPHTCLQQAQGRSNSRRSPKSNGVKRQIAGAACESKHGHGICVTDLRWYCDQGGGAYGAEPSSPAFVVGGRRTFFCANKKNTELSVSVNSGDDMRRQFLCAKPIISWHSLFREAQSHAPCSGR